MMLLLVLALVLAGLLTPWIDVARLCYAAALLLLLALVLEH